MARRSAIVVMRDRLDSRSETKVAALIKGAKEKGEVNATLRKDLRLVTVSGQKVTIPKDTETTFFCHMREKGTSWPQTMVTFFVSSRIQVSILMTYREHLEVKVIDPGIRTDARAFCYNQIYSTVDLSYSTSIRRTSGLSAVSRL